MTHIDPHKVSGYCLCPCEECATYQITGDEDKSGDCHCPLGCACHRPTPKLAPAYYAATSDTPAANAHTCKDCGTEVFRNGTRGRYPSKCPDCKAKP